MANPFYVAPPNILEALQQYDQSYKTARDDFQQSQRDALLKEIGQQIQTTGKLDNSILGRLYGGGMGMMPAANSVATVINNQMQRDIQNAQLAEQRTHNRNTEALTGRQIGQTGEYQQGQLAQSAANLENTKQQQAAELELRRAAQAEQKRQHDIAERKPIKVGPSDTLVDPITFEQRFKGAGNADETAIDIAARQDINGDQSWKTNLGRGAQGADNIQRVMNRRAQILVQERGFTPQQAAEDLGRRLQEFKSQTSGKMQEQRTLGQQEARMGTAGMEAKGAIALARGVVERLPRTSFLPWNKLVQGYQNQTLNPDQAELFARIQAIRNVYAAVMNRGANITTVNSQHRADELLNTASNAEVLNRVFNTMNQEIDMAMNSPERMRNFYKSKYGSGALQQSQNLSDQNITGVDYGNTTTSTGVKWRKIPQ